MSNQIEKYEENLLAIMINDPDSVEVATTLLEGSDFYNRRLSHVYNIIKTLSENGAEIMEDSIIEAFSSKPEFNKDLETYTSLLSTIKTQYTGSNNIKFLIEQIKQASMKRNITKFGDKIINLDKLDFSDFGGQINTLQSVFLDITESKKSDQLITMQVAGNDFMDRLKKSMNKDHHKISGVDTGFVEINSITDGFQPGDLIILAARPGVGKTALALNFAVNAAISSMKENPEKKEAVLYFSLEMGVGQLLDRIASSETLIDLSKIKRGSFTHDEQVYMQRKIEDIKKLPILIDDSSDLSIHEIHARLKQIQGTHKLKLVIVDYLQLLKGKNNFGINRQQEVSDISKLLKNYARKFEVPIIALAQLSRKIEDRGKNDGGENPRPLLSDLRESGSIEQDADLVTFLYYKTKNENEFDEVTKTKVSLPQKVEYVIEKHRNGSTGTVSLSFTKEHGKFNDFYFKGDNINE